VSSVLKVTDLTKDFGGLRAIDNVSFEVGKGEFVGLIGPNGCGKTTTFNCISGLLEPSKGEVEVFEQNTTVLRPDEIQKLGLTRTFQHTRLWREMTTIENLLIPPRNQFGDNPFYGILSHFFKDEENARVARAYDTLAELEITHMAHNLTSELSGGQSKLVDIGRALMGEPELLLLDEPVAGVAGPLAEKIFNNLRRIVSKEGISIFVIEHNMDFILRRGVDRIIVMDQGKVLMQGTPDEVKDSKEVIEAYLGVAT
jgi:ABC-type branched-subunit amino acid transport system ATPase component|tara:strand:+ start:4800 stop:5567 length:768 start_codon:yes stop_codon:yes gene_type:complete